MPQVTGTPGTHPIGEAQGRTYPLPCAGHCVYYKTRCRRQMPRDHRVLDRAAKLSPDGRTVALVFGTIDFVELALNWACHALAVGVRWFVLVAMDVAMHERLLGTSGMRMHTMLLPRVRDGNVTLTKLNVIGERQLFGLSVLSRGLSVVHSDADALWIRNPFPLFSGGDVVAERIWCGRVRPSLHPLKTEVAHLSPIVRYAHACLRGKPLSVVKAWGAGLCTGFYYLRSTPAVVGLARTVQHEITLKRIRQPGWQASDQYYVNTVLHGYGVRWASSQKMEGAQSMATRYHDGNASVGVAHTPQGRLQLVLLAHNVVPRACP